ncbi:MAG TPA: hypothetical protein VHO91_14810 [Rhodopila sp.]|nr:hypothetical protein [Rhodopila sp.]
MRLPKLVLFGGVAALALSGIARAETAHTHTMTIRLPNGQVEHIRYTGDTPPVVVVAPGARMVVAAPAMPGFVAMPDAPAMAAGPGTTIVPAAMMADPFAILRQISAEMDQQAEAMMRSVSLMASQPMPGMMQPGTIPAGVGGVAPMTIAAGPGVCMRSVQITYNGNGQPHVVSQTQGDCGPAPHQTAPAALPETPAPSSAPHTIEVKNTGPTRPYEGLVHKVSLLSR